MEDGENGESDWTAFNEAKRRLMTLETKEEQIKSLEATLKETDAAEGFVNEFIRAHFGFKETTLAEVGDTVLSLYTNEKFADIVREHPNMLKELAEAMNFDLVCIQSGEDNSEVREPTCSRKTLPEIRK